MMNVNRRGGYVRNGNDTIERECDLCGWRANAESYPELVERYQNHLRDEHPKAWVRS